MSNVIEEGPRYLPNTSSGKKHILSKVQVKNAFATGEPHWTTDELHLTQNYIQEKKSTLASVRGMFGSVYSPCTIFLLSHLPSLNDFRIYVFITCVLKCSFKKY